MKIDFFEEFPTKKNLEKLKLVDFSCKVFILAKSLEEFKKLEKDVREINKKIKCAYWPVVDNSYWVSPFSNRGDLVQLFKELESGECELLIDLELPLFNKKLILKNFFNFFTNKKLIKDFLERNKKKITTAQVPPVWGIGLRKLLGLDFDVDIKKCLMFYTSSFKQTGFGFLIKRVRKLLEGIKNKKNISIGLGVIAKGRITRKNMLSSGDLERDLNFVRKLGFERVVIFRVGGLNKDYVNVIKKFIK